MLPRVLVILLVVVFGVARSARADVSLTDQQTYASSVRAAAPLTAGLTERLVDATGLEWFVNDEVTYATQSSALGAASDAVFSGPVEASTASGGSELSILADAFDGYNGLLVSVDGGSAVSYNQLSPPTSDCNGRQIILPALNVGGVSIVRKMYVPQTDGFARWANIITNASGADHTVTLQVVNDLGSDTKTLIGATSSGDNAASTADDWVTTYEAFTNASSRTPRLAHVLSSPTAAVRPASVTFADGNDQPTWTYAVPVPAGQTAVVLNFAAGLATRSDAALKAAQLATLPPGTLVCLSESERTSLVNVAPGFPPSGPEPTGPAAMIITSPTIDPAYTATTPFLALGGQAGPANLASLSWVSNRGPAGTPQGTADWTIPSAALLPGVNVITVTANYSVGPPISDTITITLGPTSYLLPEGATGTFFNTDLLIANPTVDEVIADVKFLKDDGTTVTLPPQELPPLSRLTIPVDTVGGLEAAGGVSSVVSSATGAPLIVERTMFWDNSSYGAHGSGAVEGSRKRWLFGEGSQGFFSTFVLLANDNDVFAKVTLNFYREGLLPVVKEYTLTPHSRTTIDVSTVPEVIDTSFAMEVVADQPIAAERAMYFGNNVRLFDGGHDSTGVSLPAPTWHFAEGATGGFFETFFLLGNPGSRTANVEMKYQLVGGGTITVNRTVPPFSRVSLNAAGEDPALAATVFSLAVASDEPIVAERSMYWGREQTGQWYEAHNAFGANESANKWGLAEGRVGMDRAFKTYILIGNSTGDESRVRVSFLRVGGGTVVKEYTIAANSRFTLDVGAMVPELVNEEFGAIVEVVDGSPVIVERAMYSDQGGVLAAAGTATLGVRLP